MAHEQRERTILSAIKGFLRTNGLNDFAGDKLKRHNPHALHHTPPKRVRHHYCRSQTPYHLSAPRTTSNSLSPQLLRAWLVQGTSHPLRIRLSPGKALPHTL